MGKGNEKAALSLVKAVEKLQKQNQQLRQSVQSQFDHVKKLESFYKSKGVSDAMFQEFEDRAESILTQMDKIDNFHTKLLQEKDAKKASELFQEIQSGSDILNML